MVLWAPSDWQEYELIDSGQGMKLERFGSYIIARPDPRAIWKKHAPAGIWNEAHATYVRSSQDEGRWDIRKAPPDHWVIRYRTLTFALKPTSFKHVGVFPEQAINWKWMHNLINGVPLKVLNLFAYTGGATLACAAAGAHVTHVDAARGAIEWAKENAAASNLSGKPIRWIVEDAYKFVLREARRGNTYDAVILDPPRFGRGTKGEVWKIENDLPDMLDACRQILAPRPKFILLNAYTADLSGIVLKNMLEDMTRTFTGAIEWGELTLRDSTSGRYLPNGIFARWFAS